MFRRGGRGELIVVMMSLSMIGCSPPGIDHKAADSASMARGEAAARRLGCAACHVIPGIDWPEGQMGPALHGFADRGLIAGRLPNRPDALAAFLRDPPSLVPGTAMPAIPMSARDAQDMAAWLHGFRDE